MKKISIIIVGAFLSILGLLTLFLPSILSSNMGKSFLVKSIQSKVGGKVEIDSVSSSWTKGQKIKGFRLEKKGELFSFDSMTLDTSLWNLLFRRTSLRGNITIHEGAISLKQGGSGSAQIDQIDIQLEIPKGSAPLSIRAGGETEHHGLLGSFQVDGKPGQVEASFTNFPVAGIDALVALMRPSLRGVFFATFGDNLNLLLSKGKETISLELSSPHMQTSLLADDHEGLLQLKGPMQATWMLKPSLLKILMPHLPFSAVGDTHVQLNVGHLSLPFKNLQFDLPSLEIAGNLTLQRGALSLNKAQEPLLLDELDLSFNTSNLKERAHFAFFTTFRFSSFPKTTIRGNSTLEQTFAKWDLLAKLSQFDLEVRQFPTPLIDQLRSNQSPLQKWIGSNFDCSIKRHKEGIQSHLVLSGNSPLFNLPTSTFVIEQNCTLTAPAAFTYQITPEHFAELSKPMTLNSSLNTLVIPIKNRSIDWLQSDLDMTLESQRIHLSSPLALGTLQLSPLHVHLEGKPAASLSFKGSTRLDFSPDTLGRSLIGKDKELRAEGLLRMGKEFEMAPLKVSLEGEEFKSSVEGTLKGGVFTLKKPLILSAVLQPNSINSLLSKWGSHFPLLAKQTPFHFQVTPGHFPLTREALSQLELKITGYAESLEMTGPQTNFSFEEVSLDFDLDGSKKRSRFEFEAHALEGDEAAGTMKLFVESRSGDVNPLKNPSEVRFCLSKLSTAIADPLFQMRGSLSPMVGSSVNLRYSMKETSRGDEIEIELKSPYLSASGSFIAHDQLELKSNRHPLKIEWNVSEEGYRAYKKWRHPDRVLMDPPFRIKNRAEVTAQVSPLILPLKKEEGFFPQIDTEHFHPIFDAIMRIDSLTLEEDHTQEIPTLKGFDLRVQREKIEGPLTFQMEGSINLRDGGKSGSIKGEGKVDKFEDLTGSIHARVQRLPTVFLDVFSQLKNPSSMPPSAILGDLVNASYSAELVENQGKLNVDIDATHCRASLSGDISNGTLYLNKPLTASMIMTPKMNEILSRNIKIALVSKENPFTLTVREQGFSVPIKDFSLRGVNLPSGTIDFGQLTCRNTGSASDVSSLFKMKGDENLISLWIAPIEFNVRKGVVSISRTEILYNRAYHVALWGRINYMRRSVSMILGLTAQSLAAAFGIRNLDPNYVLQVPVRGPFGNVKIDKREATRKITFLLARRKMIPQKGVLGKVLGTIGSFGDDQSSVPPPKTPFPWQK